MGEPPLRVDVLQVLSGVGFDECWDGRAYAVVNDSFEVPVIPAAKLIVNKLAAGRPRDLLDVEEMQRTIRLLRRFESPQE